jgi:hypothetical protein
VTSHFGSFKVHLRVKKQQPKYARQCRAAPFNFGRGLLSYGLGLALIEYMRHRNCRLDLALIEFA